MVFISKHLLFYFFPLISSGNRDKNAVGIGFGWHIFLEMRLIFRDSLSSPDLQINSFAQYNRVYIEHIFQICDLPIK